MMERLKNARAGFANRWFVEASPSILAALRIVVGMYSLMYLLSRRRMLFHIGDNVDLYDPVGLAEILGSPLPSDLFGILVGLAILLNVAFVLGWGFRISGPAFGGLLLFVLCYRNSWSMIFHSDNLLVFHVMILGWTRAADAWSVDALTRKGIYRWMRQPCIPIESIRKTWQYGWPIQLICTVTIAAYFLAGVAKVAGPLGWSWAGGDALRSQIAADVLRKELLVDNAPYLAQFLFDHVGLCFLFGIATLFLELGAPLAIFSKRFSRVWVVAIFLMHWGILLFMGIKFRYQLTGVAFMSFVLRDFILTNVASTPATRRERPLPTDADPLCSPS